MIWPSSNTRNVDNTIPAIMSDDLPSKKSKLDLRLFGVGVLIVGSKAMP